MYPLIIAEECVRVGCLTQQSQQLRNHTVSTLVNIHTWKICSLDHCPFDFDKVYDRTKQISSVQCHVGGAGVILSHTALYAGGVNMNTHTKHTTESREICRKM